MYLTQVQRVSLFYSLLFVAESRMNEGFRNGLWRLPGLNIPHRLRQTTDNPHNPYDVCIWYLYLRVCTCIYIYMRNVEV